MFHKYLAALVLVPSIAFAQGESKVSLVSDPFNEVLRQAAQISGARVVGVTAVGRVGGVPRVMATIPADWKNTQICLKVVSADGLYEAINVYTVVADWIGGRVALPYPSKSPEEVANIKGDLISGILLKGDCSTTSNESAPVFWGSGNYGPIRVLLNTARADETFLTFPEHPEIGDIACKLVEAVDRNAFDTVCEIPETLASNDQITAIALSFKNGEMGREEYFKLRLGGAP